MLRKLRSIQATPAVVFQSDFIAHLVEQTGLVRHNEMVYAFSTKFARLDTIFGVI